MEENSDVISYRFIVSLSKGITTKCEIKLEDTRMHLQISVLTLPTLSELHISCNCSHLLVQGDRTLQGLFS